MGAVSCLVVNSSTQVDQPALPLPLPEQRPRMDDRPGALTTLVVRWRGSRPLAHDTRSAAFRRPVYLPLSFPCMNHLMVG